MVNFEVEQHSLSWFRQRIGYITGSQVGLLMKSGRNAIFSETAKSYIYQIAAERDMNDAIINDDELFSQYIQYVDVSSKAMRFGTENEGNARTLYSKIIGQDILEVGSCKHESIPYFASSPDGYIENKITGEKIVIEIKCPTQATYMRYVDEIDEKSHKIQNGALVITDSFTESDIIECANTSLLSVKPEYYYQCMAHIACTGADYCVFIAYCPFQNHPIHTVRIYPDLKVIAEMENRITMANDIINQIIDFD